MDEHEKWGPKWWIYFFRPGKQEDDALATDVLYLGSEAADLHDALDGEEDGEDEIAVGQEVGVVQGGAVVLKWNDTITLPISAIQGSLGMI